MNLRASGLTFRKLFVLLLTVLISANTQDITAQPYNIFGDDEWFETDYETVFNLSSTDKGNIKYVQDGNITEGIVVKFINKEKIAYGFDDGHQIKVDFKHHVSGLTTEFNGRLNRKLDSNPLINTKAIYELEGENWNILNQSKYNETELKLIKEKKDQFISTYGPEGRDLALSVYPKEASTGDEWKITNEQINYFLGKNYKDIKGKGEIKLTEVSEVNGELLATLALTLECNIKETKDGEAFDYHLSLSGNVVRWLELSLDKSYDLSGQMKLNGAPVEAQGKVYFTLDFPVQLLVNNSIIKSTEE